MTQNNTVGGQELISFRVGDQEFCVDIMSVREIRGWTKASPMPHSPSYVRGVINLRGAVLPVIDLRARLGQGLTEPDQRHVIIVARVQDRTVGLLVDAVSDILTATESSIQPPPNVGCDIAKTFIRGILASEGRMISLISMDDVLADPQAEAA